MRHSRSAIARSTTVWRLPERIARLRPLAFAVPIVCLFALATVADTIDDHAAVSNQPTQPLGGPGSSDYTHGGIQVSKYGQAARQYWLFTPKDPVPEQAPVVIFLHGWATMEPDAYGAWIQHIVRRGNIVIYPRYQEGFGTLPNSFLNHAVSAIHDALDRLKSDGAIQPQLDKLACVGHSMGAILSANLAQNASRFDVPAPKCLFLAEPAFEPLLGRYDRVPAETLLVVVVGADVKRDASARKILNGTTRVALASKNYVALFSDLHGNPALISDHFAPCAASEIEPSRFKSARNDWRGRTCDSLDYFGYWKICDGLLDAAFHSRHREFALGDTPEIRFMGQWSDGTPVEPAKVLNIAEPTESASR